MGLLTYSELFDSFGNGTSLVPLEKILTEVTVNWFANTRRHEPQRHSGVLRGSARKPVAGPTRNTGPLHLPKIDLILR